MSELSNAIKQICDEKGLSYEAVITTIESALSAAYRKDFGEKNQNIKVEFDPETAKSKVFDVKAVVEDLPPEEEEEDKNEDEAKVKIAKEVKKNKNKNEDKKDENKDEEDKNIIEEVKENEEEKRKFNPKTEIQISDAKLIKKTIKLGGELKMKLEVPAAYGRMAAQTAKQVIIQRLREAEREMIFNDFKDKEHEVVSGVIQRQEGRIVLIDLGKAVGVLPKDEQIYGEQYRPGERIKIYVKGVSLQARGPEIILSRTSDEILKKIFYLEIPEIANGLIELKNVAREAGSRAKVAVWTDSDNVDPIGSCVGQKGARIQTIIGELGGEKVDIIEYDEDPVKYIINSLSPAKILNVEINEKEPKAKVYVTSDQLSLAIGKGGQNARLAARLTGWKIDILEKKEEEKKELQKTEEAEEDKDDNKKTKKQESKKTDNKKSEEKDKDDKKKNKKQKSKKAEKKDGGKIKEKADDKKAEKDKDKKVKKKDKKTDKKDSKNSDSKEK